MRKGPYTNNFDTADRKENGKVVEEKKQPAKAGKICGIIFLVIIVLFIGSCVSGGGQGVKDGMAGLAKDVDCHTGSGAVNGMMSLIEIDKDEVNEEWLVEWCKYIQDTKGEYNYYIVKYKGANEGCWGIDGCITTNIKLENDGRHPDEWYQGANTSETKTYAYYDGKLNVIED